MMSINKHNPDVLSCLANLSNDEVFTPPDVVNRMLDLLPQELFESTETTFLDPCCKTGVFLREIAKRLLRNQVPGYEQAVEEINEKEMKGERLSPEDKFFKSELQKCVDHIFHNQLYGIAITEMTSLLSRRSVYCSKSPDSFFSISKFDTGDGNIRFKRIQHTWINGKCKYCGANEEQYNRGEELETHAYEWIHTEHPERIFNMKFDVIISNPPYQLSDGSGGSSDSAMPIYQKFITQSKKMNPKNLVMIVPSKWMVGGRGLDSFREEMQNDHRIETMVDYENASACFPGIHIDGGVCYFLWKNNYKGKCRYRFVSNDGTSLERSRYLKNEHFDYVIRDIRVSSILEKTSKDGTFSDIVSSVKPFGIRGFLFNEPERYPEANLKDKPYKDSLHIYGVKGIKGGARRVDGYVSRKLATSNIDAIGKYKLFFTTSYSTNAVIPPDAIEAGPSEICTETFLLIGPFKNQKQQQNCHKYMTTKFFRAMLYHGKGTMHVNKSVFGLIPLQDFSREWTDEDLYEKYQLTRSEIDFIEGLFEVKNA